MPYMTSYSCCGRVFNTVKGFKHHLDTMHPPITEKLICIVCRVREVNPMISETEKPSGKSFCSRICQEIYYQSDLQFMSPDALARVASAAHSRNSNG